MAIASEPGEGITRVHMSWNGASDVTAWRILSGDSEEQLEAIAVVDRTGFETTADITPAGSRIVVEALKENKERIGSTTVD